MSGPLGVVQRRFQRAKAEIHERRRHATDLRDPATHVGVRGCRSSLVPRDLSFAHADGVTEWLAFEISPCAGRPDPC